MFAQGTGEQSGIFRVLSILLGLLWARSLSILLTIIIVVSLSFNVVTLLPRIGATTSSVLRFHLQMHMTFSIRFGLADLVRLYMSAVKKSSEHLIDSSWPQILKNMRKAG